MHAERAFAYNRRKGARDAECLCAAPPPAFATCRSDRRNPRRGGGTSPSAATRCAAAGAARDGAAVVLSRAFPDDTEGMPQVFVNGAPAGYAEGGTSFYRDVPAGPCQISVDSYRPGLFQPDDFVVAPGQQLYVEIVSLPHFEEGGGRGGYERYVLSVAGLATDRRNHVAADAVGAAADRDRVEERHMDATALRSSAAQGGIPRRSGRGARHAEGARRSRRRGVACKVETGRALVEAGLHPASGGTGLEACSGDMLLEALVACAGVTLSAVATALNPLRGGTVRAEGDLDFRGTLGVERKRRWASGPFASLRARHRRTAGPRRHAAEADGALLRRVADAAPAAGDRSEHHADPA